MDNDAVRRWFDNKLTLLEQSDDPRDIKLMLELLKARSQLKMDSIVEEQLFSNYDQLSDAELMEILRGRGD